MRASTRRLSHAVVLAALLSLPELSFGQDKVAIGATPMPGQTVRLRMRQEMEADIKAEGTPPPGLPPEGVHTKTASNVLLRLETAALDADGRLRVDVNYEEGSQEAQINGKAMPLPSAQDALRGTTITMWLKGSQVDEVKVPENYPIPAELLKQFMGPLVASIPRLEMTVGQTAEVPLSLTLPLPSGAGPAPVLNGITKTTLTNVAPDGADLLATLAQVVDASVDMTNEAAGTRVRTVMKISGTGTTETYVKAGLVKTSRMDAKLTGRLETQAANAPVIVFDGTMKLTVTRER